ncbi:MAG TPA: MarR family transcriptional regulator [Burkholderiaceae bacterium]|nr:MarR family transcriptional regulator [Burkholderiaceae bacterium]
MIGSLLRLPHEVVMARMRAALDSAGFDITSTELGVFLYPGPEGRRPADLARQCSMTRQAMNYVLMGLERRGYLERHANPGGTTLIRMTAKGWATFDPIRTCVREIEQEWTAHLGARRFEALRGTLHELALRLGKLG